MINVSAEGGLSDRRANNHQNGQSGFGFAPSDAGSGKAPGPLGPAIAAKTTMTMTVLQRARWFRRQLLGRLRRRGQEIRVRHDSGHQTKFRSPSGAERQSQEKQLPGTEVSEPRSSARVTYKSDVIAFFFSGRFNWIRKVLPDRSVRISLIVHLPWLLLLDA
jgi:hypothetical protein